MNNVNGKGIVNMKVGHAPFRPGESSRARMSVNLHVRPVRVAMTSRWRKRELPANCSADGAACSRVSQESKHFSLSLNSP